MMRHKKNTRFPKSFTWYLVYRCHQCSSPWPTGHHTLTQQAIATKGHIYIPLVSDVPSRNYCTTAVYRGITQHARPRTPSDELHSSSSRERRGQNAERHVHLRTNLLTKTIHIFAKPKFCCVPLVLRRKPASKSHLSQGVYYLPVLHG